MKARLSPDCVRIEKVLGILVRPGALLVEIKGDERWIPYSVIHVDSEVYQKGDEGDLIIAEWFARKEKLA